MGNKQGSPQGRYNRNAPGRFDQEALGAASRTKSSSNGYLATYNAPAANLNGNAKTTSNGGLVSTLFERVLSFNFKINR